MKVIRSRKKLFFYACGAFGVNLLNLIMGSYLCSALIATGFDTAALKNHTFEGIDLVIPAVWAVFTVLAKVIDGVIDIPMASLSDRMKSRWGRRRPSLIIGLVPMIAAYMLFLLVPNKEGKTLLNTIYFFGMLAVFYTFYTLTMVTYYATFTEIVDNEEDRRFITNVKSVCDIVYFIVGFVVVAALLKGFNVRIVALMMLPLVFLMLIPVFMIKEESTKDGAGQYQKTVNLFKSLGYTFKNKDFIIWMVVYSFMTFGLQLFLSGINEFFSVSGLNMIFVMMSAFAPVPFTFIIFNALIRKKGFRFAYQYVLLVYSFGMLAMWGISYLQAGTLKMVLAIVCGLISSCSVGAMFAVGYSIPSQLAADDEARTGISHSAMYFAVQGLFSGVASGIGGGAVLTLLKTLNIAGNKGTFYITFVSAVGCLIAFALTFILPKSIVELGKKKQEPEQLDNNEVVEQNLE